MAATRSFLYIGVFWATIGFLFCFIAVLVYMEEEAKGWKEERNERVARVLKLHALPSTFYDHDCGSLGTKQ